MWCWCVAPVALAHVSCAACRTLTPFGFQAEERTLWQAPETYAVMSPFQNADLIKKPLLLIHGADDNNTGTFPLQAPPRAPCTIPHPQSVPVSTSSSATRPAPAACSF